MFGAMRALLLAVAVLGAWWWLRDDDVVATDRNEQAAVLRDGFAWRVDRKVRVLDRKGEKRDEHVIDRAGDVRVVGTRGGPAAAWLEQGTIRFINVKTGKTIGVWGKDARMLCDGVATNDERFAVGWLEGDGKMWWVHGDTRPTSDDAFDAGMASEASVEMLAADPRDWCGIASAGDRVAIFWREKNRLFINSCTRKKCDSLPAAVTLGEHAVLLGFGCVARSCMLAVQERNGTRTLSYITESGGTKWTKQLSKTARDFSIVGVGKTSFAIAYASDEGTEVLHAEKKPKTTRVWHAESGRAPVIAWSLGQLFIGHGDRTTIVSLPE
jgi:hypothetical protein